MEDTFDRGVDFFNEGDFFKAHEVWEKLWMNAAAPRKRTFLQGMIMVAAALHHYRRGEYAGTLKLLARGLAQIRNEGEAIQGIDTGDFAEKISIFYDRIRVPDARTAEPTPPPELPKIRKRTVHAKE